MNHCKYHPIVDAQYYCEYCDVDVCSACSAEPSEFRQNNEYRCFICNSRLEKLNPAGSIQPFWRRVPEIHRYPLSTSGLTAIVFTSIMLVFSGFLGGLAAIFSSILLLMYCFACLGESTTGNVSPPSFTEVLSGKANVIVALLGVYVISGILITLAFYVFGQGIGILISILFIIAIPAILMVLAVEQSMFGALNLSKIIQIIKACGSSYLLMLLFIIILSSSMGVVSSVVDTNSRIMFLFLTNIVSSYYFIIIFHVMGYLVYQNNHELDFYVVEQKQEKVKARPENKLAEMEVEILLKEGQFKQATSNFYKLLKQNNTNNLYWRKYFNLIVETRNGEAIRKFSDNYFDKLLEGDDRLTLVQTYKAFKTIVPNLAPKTIEMKLSIAEAALENREFGVVPALLQNISKETEDKQLVKQSMEMMAKAFGAIPDQSHKAKIFSDMALQLDS